MLNANEIRGLYAILPTPAKAGAERLSARNTVDLDETARVVNAMIDDGCKGLIALGTTGECATLSQDDYEAFVRCLVETAGKRVPTFVGTSAMGGIGRRNVRKGDTTASNRRLRPIHTPMGMAASTASVKPESARATDARIWSWNGRPE